MDRLIRERKSLEPRLKRISETVEKIRPEAVDEIDLQTELDALSEVWMAFCGVHKKILDLCEEDSAYDEAMSRQGKFESCYIGLKTRLLKLLKIVKNRDQATPPVSSQQDVIKQLADQQAEFLRIMSANMVSPVMHAAVMPPDASRLPDLKLPQVNIPKFSGDYLEWQSFKDLFDSLVEQNPTLKDSQKLYFLKTNLAGEAASLISHLKIEDANYKPALEKLASRYDKPREIANKHIQRFLSQPPLSFASASGLRALHDVSDEVLRALKATAREDRDTWLLFILSEKVDPDTKQLWCQKISEMKEEEITLTRFLKFVEARSFALQSSHPIKPKAFVPVKQPAKFPTRGATTFVTTNPTFCDVCSAQYHHLFQCGKFIHMSYHERLAQVNRLKLCRNCLKTHPGSGCKGGTCRKCNFPHHTLLHPPTTQNMAGSPTNQQQSAQSFISALDSAGGRGSANVLLATVAINVLDKKGHPHACRAILDSASQVNFISDSLRKQLGLDTSHANVDLEGISSATAHADRFADIVITSRCTNYQTSVPCLVLERITKFLPCKPAIIKDWPIPHSIPLADPLFHRPGKVDVLLGTEIFFQLLEPGQIILSPDNSLPTLQNTKLGWVIAGRYHEPKPSVDSHSPTCLLISAEDDLFQQLQRFWEIEEYTSNDHHLTDEEQRCEKHFAENTIRDECGKFVVRLPFLSDPIELGESRQIAERRLYHIERKLDRNPSLKAEYHEFIRDYIDLGHMSLVEESNSPEKSVYLPHHCVIKTTSSTTKCRVVFDASAKTSNGLSLNDTLMCGPVIQDSLINILLRFRFPPVVLAGDAKQMYRMVWLHENDRDFLKILWRWSKEEPVKEYRLNTVTFGTKSASYLATKCVQQLLDSFKLKYPEAVEKAEKGIYVDDILTGASSEKEAIMLREQLTEMFAAGGFHLRKWVSNSAAVLETVPEADLEIKISIDEGGNNSIKALGMQWQPCSDEFHFSYNPKEILQHTKRAILSQIASLFDPLGLLAPIIVKAKLVMQRMWELKVAWDATPPGELVHDWLMLVQSFSRLNLFQIPRRVIHLQNWSRLYLHGYCDASDVAMGACIYVRALDNDGNMSSHLLCAKSKLAPIGNNRMTTPRLKLRAAVSLARLMSNVRAALATTTFYEIRAFSDSQVVLAWLAGGAARWKTFVANRVAEITAHLPAINWHHVGTAENPADLISRGVFPEKLQHNTLWWHGPDWNLASTSLASPSLDTNERRQIAREQRTNCSSVALACFTTYENQFMDDMMARYYPNFQLLLRITARMLRFRRREFRDSPRLCPEEIDFALTIYLQHTQKSYFPEELGQLQSGHGVNRGSPLHQLNPFLDENGLVRVGGRLQQSELSFDIMHPILLPRNSMLTAYILLHSHQENLHCGPQQLLASVRRRFWILRGISAARKVCRNCVVCNRTRPARIMQQMGQLPADRLQPLPPFSITGVDYAGPVNILSRRTRGAVPSKGYIALFICFGTRAVHLEAVSDLSVSAFLAAFTRFTSRYGVPNKMYSDNATNFRGAAKLLRQLYEQIAVNEGSGELQDFLTNKGVQWLFIPARSPHHGGLWEAGVKVAKTFLNKIGNYNYTFEELSTFLAQVAACMNSRPISAISDDPTDPQPLTPAHFLIGRALDALPEINHLEQQIGSLSRWNYVQRVAQDFRARWQSEYILSLQKLAKWQKSSPNLAEGDFVLLVGENEKPQQWPMGRVLQLHPGTDGLVRVVSVKTSTGVFRRDVRKLRHFPLDVDEFVAGRNGAEITNRNLVGGLCWRRNVEPPYNLRSRVV
ncbi:uncharacterized protein LOC129729089 [Wyeomyia smithii]|uniref:uncharacterized protein LOC129729089 n=1 Tax=Wyeomyia smithii TaxID=174621 RepID=UPI002467C7A3|nr:uncharacterized protein LOC129729089 [Wyeomyia smithii]